MACAASRSVDRECLDAFRKAIDRSLDLAGHAREQILASPDLELTAPPSLGVLCFRRRGRAEASEAELARTNAELIRGLEASRNGLVSSTRLRGRFTVRMCCLNHSSTAQDVERMIEHFAHGLGRRRRAATPAAAQNSR